MDIPNSGDSSTDEEIITDDNRRDSIISDRNSNLPNLQSLQSRRQANDPHMMKELDRYQRIMFLTLLPSISNTDSTPAIQQPLNINELQQQHLNNQEAAGTIITMQKSSNAMSSRKMSLMERKGSFPNLGSIQKEKARRISDIGNRRSTMLDERSLTSSNQIMKSDDVSSIKKQLQPNEISEREEVHTSVEPTGNNLDFTTLTALYLESRKKIFGDEWTNRPFRNESKREEVGSTGVFKPRRLSPLEAMHVGEPIEIPNTYPNLVNNIQGLQMHTMPTPAGLHLSANFTQTYGIDPNAPRDRSRKGSHRSRLMRLNSLDDFSVLGHDEEMDVGSLHRPNSAPGISKLKVDSESIPMVTPARANTPTEPHCSARVTRPQLIGGSLATYSPDESMNNSESKKTPLESTKYEDYSMRQIKRSLSLPKNQDIILSAGLQQPPRKDSRLRLSPLDSIAKKNSMP